MIDLGTYGGGPPPRGVEKVIKMDSGPRSIDHQFLSGRITGFPCHKIKVYIRYSQINLFPVAKAVLGKKYYVPELFFF